MQDHQTDEPRLRRTVEVLRRDGSWHPAAFMSLQRGNIFRLREPDGRLTNGSEGDFALDNPYYGPNGVATIACQDVLWSD